MVSKSKGSKPGEQESSYAVKDIVLAKIRGFPAWPGMVVDPDTVPPAVQKERPTSKKTSFYCVRFFPAGDFSWTVAKDLSRLHAHEIDSFLGEPHKKSGDLYKGYEIAKDPEVWLIKQDALAADMAEEEENAPFDQLESDAESAEPKTVTKSKKRKREVDSAPVSKAKAKPKAKKTSEEPASKKKAAAGGKGKKNGAKSKEMVESEDEGGPEGDDDDSGPSKKLAAPASKKAKKEKADAEDPLENDEEAKRVREWRHKLQKAFLTPKAPPKSEDMPQLDALFTGVEQYDKMSIEYLSFSKIGKVMRHIAALKADNIPRNAEYNFLTRAQTLVDKWHEILNSKKNEGSHEGTSEPKPEPTNGDGTEVDTGAMEVDTGETAAAEAAE